MNKFKLFLIRCFLVPPATLFLIGFLIWLYVFVPKSKRDEMFSLTLPTYEQT
ncbi:hypothetical protein ACQ4M3_08840 [Leptolyngbya sp. AN03gr2]|uniref:hypothetical protein n=1 Tax=unclassified Leptolyngbya TaxID=2650499 RepID=UPI003D3168AB